MTYNKWYDSPIGAVILGSMVFMLFRVFIECGLDVLRAMI